MGKIKLDKNAKELFRAAGAKGGIKTKETHDSEYYSRIAGKAYKARVKREGSAAIREKMRQNGLKSAEIRRKKKEAELQKSNEPGFKSRITKFLQHGDVT